MAHGGGIEVSARCWEGALNPMAGIGGGNGRVAALPSLAALPRFFSGEVEDSLRLRLLGLAAFWLVAIAIGLEGGSPWT